MLTVMETKQDKECVDRDKYLERVEQALNGTGGTCIRAHDVVDAMRELVLDAGPKYLHHVKFWSSAEMSDDIPDLMEKRHGVKVPRLELPRPPRRPCDAGGQVVARGYALESPATGWLSR